MYMHMSLVIYRYILINSYILNLYVYLSYLRLSLSL